jgi:hypothetical protein
MTSARELTNRLADLLRDEHGAMADFILALSDFDARQLWRELGHTSLFYFLRRELRLSAGAAQYRKTAAELVRTFPEVEAALREGRLCLSTVVEVAKVLTPENRAEVLPRFFGLSRRRPTSGSGWEIDRREHEARVPCPQRSRGTPGLRQRVDGQVHEGRLGAPGP